MKDKYKTKVTFYVEVNGGILAYFNNTTNDYLKETKTCYAHIGQHSCCHPNYVRKLQKATTEQYAALKEELESIGYNLSIKNK